MKSKSNYLSIIFMSILFAGCYSHAEIVKFKPHKDTDYINKELEVYEPKEILYAILDSIITKAEECPEYQGRKQKITFSFSIERKSILESKEEYTYPHLCISVRYYISSLCDYRWTEGMFDYKGYEFYVNSHFDNAFLKKTGQTTSVACIDPEKYQSDALYRGDRDMYWWYQYKHETLLNTQHGYCPNPK